MVPTNRTIINHNICNQTSTKAPNQSDNSKSEKRTTIKRYQKLGLGFRTKSGGRYTPCPESDGVPLLDLETLILLI